MSKEPIEWLRSWQKVPQISVNPETLATAAAPCQGGPCDGQEMRCPMGFILIVTKAVDGLRASAHPPAHLGLAKQLGGYAGHYDRHATCLTWAGKK